MAIQHIMHLVGNGFQRCPDDVVLVHATGDADDRASGVLIPVGRSKTGESRHHITAVGILHLSGQILGILSGIDETQSHPAATE